MGRNIPDESAGGNGGDFAPTALLKEKDAMLKGVVIGKRDVKTQFGAMPVYSFKVVDASCKFTKNKVDFQPEEGDTVEAFASTRLARQLAHVAAGETVTITYKGTKKIGRGNPAHVYDVVVEE